MADLMESAGPIYVSEFGRLSCPRGYEVKCSTSKSEDDSETSGPTDSWTSAGFSSAVEPPSLFLICIQFVAQHLDYVDSLVGFPSLVGKALFTKAEELGQFASLTKITSQRLLLFQEAYGADCLSELNITGSPVFARRTLRDLPMVYLSISCLEICGCQIGYHDELMMQINQLCNLRQLSLMDNRLTNGVIKKWTAPMRICSKGLVHLKLLNLACNPSLGDGIVKYLKCFPHLENLDLSGTSITEVGVTQLCLDLKLSGSLITSGGGYKGWHCTSKGWASGVLRQWQQQANTAVEDDTTPTSQSSGRAGAFYRKQTKVRPLLRLEHPDTIIQLSASHTIHSTLGPDKAAVVTATSSQVIQRKLTSSASRKRQIDEIDIVDMVHTNISPKQKLCNTPPGCISKGSKRTKVEPPSSQSHMDGLDFLSGYLPAMKSATDNEQNRPAGIPHNGVKVKKKIKVLSNRNPPVADSKMCTGSSVKRDEQIPEHGLKERSYESALFRAMNSW